MIDSIGSNGKWSPSGNEIIYFREHNLMLYETATKQSHLVYKTSWYEKLWNYYWVNEGKYILISCPGGPANLLMLGSPYAWYNEKLIRASDYEQVRHDKINHAIDLWCN